MMEYDGGHKIGNDRLCAETNTSDTLPRAPLSTEIINTEQGFDSLEQEWTGLIDRSECTVFQTFEWQRAWWEHFLRNGKRELHCLVFRDGDKVTGIAPMYFDRIRLFGMNIFSTLELIAGGYTDIIADNAYKDEVFAALAKHLRSTSDKWDVFRTGQIAATSNTPELMIRHFREEAMKVYPVRGITCPQVVLPGTWEEYLQLIGQNMRHKVKRKTKALKDIADFEIEMVDNPGNEVDRAVELFADVYGRRRRRLGDRSWLDVPQNFSFIEDVSGRFARRGWLKIFFLKIESTTVAANLHFHFKNRIYGYLCGVDGRSEVMKYSPGFLLHCNAIKQGISEGMGLYDMMFGSHQYKLDSFKGEPLRAWEIQVVFPSPAHYYRYLVLQQVEIFKRAYLRMGEEYREVKRYRLTKDPSLVGTVRFVASRIRSLLHVLRLRTLQIVRGSKMTLEEADRKDA